MNKVILTGNLASDPELKTVGDGLSVCRFRLAVNRGYVNAQGVREADFISVTAWRQLAQICAQHLSKGKKIGVVGELQVRAYAASDGTRRYAAEVVAGEIEFLSPKTAPQETVSAAPEDAQTGFTEVDDDELPF